MSAPERRATPFGGTLAVLVAALAGLALGIADGATAATAASVGGGVVAALGVRAFQSEANARRAVGSVGVVTGALAFAGVAGFEAGLVAVLAGVAVAAAAVNAAAAVDSDLVDPLGSTVWRSASVLVVGGGLALGVSVGAFAAFGRVAIGGLVSAATQNDLVRLVVLQIEILLVFELVYWVVPILDDWLPEDRDLRAKTLDRFGYRIEDVSRGYWLFFVFQLVLALTAWGPRWFDAFLGSLSVFGTAIRFALRSGVLHGLFAGILAALVAVLVGRGVQMACVVWAGRDPPRALAHATGGLVMLAVAAVVAVSPLADALGAAAGPSWALAFESLGATATISGTVAVALLAVAAGGTVVGHAVQPWVADSAATGFAVASSALVVAALVASDGGASALAVFVGVAGALVVLDVGTNGVELGTQIGRVAETRAGEATHAVGSLLVAAGGVALALLTAFVMGSATISVPAWRARLAVVLSLVAVLCFVVLLGRE
ncbi:DUF7519 family protein [Halorussus amylolyticus]|uniref:DUF7519 family protein n=1 Tax=Halorussus amylolyticus TaxID=1126242 RepID=UPI00104988A2|nr:hypothetical protein [Halorussus amylolyticus]